MVTKRQHFYFFSLIIFIALLNNACQSNKKPQAPQVLAEIDFEPSSPNDMAINTKTGRIYVVNGSNGVGILRGTQQVASFVWDIRDPKNVAIDEQNDRAYVANYYGNSVTIIQGTQILTTIDITVRNPQDVAIDPKTGWAYVVSGYEDSPTKDEKIVAGNVTIISSTQIINVIPLGRVLAKHIIYEPINGYMYVGETGGDGEVVVIDGLIEIARFNVGSSVKAMDVNPQTGEVYVINASNRLLSQFKNGQLTATLLLPEKSRPHNLRVHPTTGDVYIVDLGISQAIVVRDMAVIGSVPLIWDPDKINIDPFSGNVYITNYMKRKLTIIHGTQVLTTVQLSGYPNGIGVNPLNGWVYVSNGDNVTVLGYPE